MQSSPWQCAAGQGPMPIPDECTERTKCMQERKPRSQEQQVVQMRVPSTNQTSACMKLIRISGTAMRQQLLEPRALDHELASIIIRGYTHPTRKLLQTSECPYMKWRHNMEPGFATIVLVDHEYVTNISIQDQLVGKDIPYDITSSQMFFLPVPLEEGWILLMWDMIQGNSMSLTPSSKVTVQAKHQKISMK